jgi:hypothetical protein
LLRILMAGPLPPLVGGMSTVIEGLSHSSLAREVDLILFDTRKPTREGRRLGEALGARLRLWRAWWADLGGAGVTELIEAMAGLPERVRLVLAGGDEEPGATAKARAQAADLGVIPRVQFAGTVLGADKIALLRNSDLDIKPG